MADMSNYLKNKILVDNLDGVYAALFNDGNEVEASGYERRAISFNDPDEGQTSNDADILFPIAEEEWGDITEISIYDSETGGNQLFRSEPEIVKNIDESSQYKIPESYLVVRVR